MTSSRSIHLLDYGAGNVRSLVNALKYIGWDVIKVTKPEDLLVANVRHPSVPPFMNPYPNCVRN